MPYWVVGVIVGAVAVVIVAVSVALYVRNRNKIGAYRQVP